MDKTYQHALITGGSSGIGFALAQALAQEGTSLGLLARDPGKLASAKEAITTLVRNEKQSIETLSCDITDYPNLQQELEKYIQHNGIPDLVINSAGVTHPGYFQDLDVEIFHEMMEVNFFGTLYITKCTVPHMISKGSGTIVNISSQAGFLGVFGYSAYGASKYATRGFSDVLRAEMKPLGIKVAIVFPPDTQTPQLDYEKALKPPETKAIAGNAKVLTAEQVAQSILKGLRKGQYVIIPGLEGKIFYRLVGLLGNLTYPVMDWLVRKAQKEKDLAQ
jgi:3-dehydrosphinganine reductase